jgi:hypothetical protein
MNNKTFAYSSIILICSHPLIVGIINGLVDDNLSLITIPLYILVIIETLSANLWSKYIKYLSL